MSLPSQRSRRHAGRVFLGAALSVGKKRVRWIWKPISWFSFVFQTRELFSSPARDAINYFIWGPWPEAIGYDCLSMPEDIPQGFLCGERWISPKQMISTVLAHLQLRKPSTLSTFSNIFLKNVARSCLKCAEAENYSIFLQGNKAQEQPILFGISVHPSTELFNSPGLLARQIVPTAWAGVRQELIIARSLLLIQFFHFSPWGIKRSLPLKLQNNLTIRIIRNLLLFVFAYLCCREMDGRKWWSSLAKLNGGNTSFHGWVDLRIWRVFPKHKSNQCLGEKKVPRWREKKIICGSVFSQEAPEVKFNC